MKFKLRSIAPATKHRAALGLATALILVPVMADGAFVLDSGTAANGIVSAGGSFQLRAVIGQAAAGPALTGGSFELLVGLASYVTVRSSPGAPSLQISLLSTEDVMISWPVTPEAYHLEYCTDLASGVWQEEKSLVTKTATSRFVVVPAKGMRCYRLMLQK